MGKVKRQKGQNAELKGKKGKVKSTGKKGKHWETKEAKNRKNWPTKEAKKGKRQT